MAKLTAKQRKALPAKDFGVPSTRSYPLENPSHAKVAKARASEMASKDKLGGALKAKIDRKANKVLGLTKTKNK